MTVDDLLRADRSRIVKECAAEHGFLFCGIANSTFLEQEAKPLEQWLSNGKHSGMQYMENHFDMRLNPGLLVPGAKSVISLGYNYYSPAKQPLGSPKVSIYAHGEDYHTVVRGKLIDMLHSLRASIGNLNARVFTDSAPIMEKAWAVRSGGGWLGKHTNVIRKAEGSWFFLAEIVSDLSLFPDGPVLDHCGNCTKCLDACPTGAITEPYIVDGGRCISYFTIELKEQIIPSEWAGKFDDWAFGCDVCQQVCPWNRFAKPHNEPRFRNDRLVQMTASDWNHLSEEAFAALFSKSALKRAKYKGLMRNLDFLRIGKSSSRNRIE